MRRRRLEQPRDEESCEEKVREREREIQKGREAERASESGCLYLASLSKAIRSVGVCRTFVQVDSLSSYKQQRLPCMKWTQ